MTYLMLGIINMWGLDDWWRLFVSIAYYKLIHQPLLSESYIREQAGVLCQEIGDYELYLIM